MGTKGLIVLVVAAALVAGCSASSLKSRKDDSWGRVSESLPDGKYIHNPSLPTLSKLPDPTWAGSDTVPSAYGHPFRPLGFVFHPFGVALDWVLVKPFYIIAGFAPEWFGLSADDGHSYYDHMPELSTTKDAPRYRYE